MWGTMRSLIKLVCAPRHRGGSTAHLIWDSIRARAANLVSGRRRLTEHLPRVSCSLTMSGFGLLPNTTTGVVERGRTQPKANQPDFAYLQRKTRKSGFGMLHL